MTTLQTIMQMQQQGMSDQQIIQTLQSQGISSNEINDALNQAKVKGALSTTQQSTQTAIQPQVPNLAPLKQTQAPNSNNINTPTPQQSIGTQASSPQVPQQGSLPQSSPQPSISSGFTQTPQQSQPVNNYPPQQTQQPQASIMDNQSQVAQQSYQQPYQNNQNYQDPYAQDYYQGDGYYDGYDYNQAGYADTETISEIAEQVVNTKFKEFKRKTGDITAFQTSTTEKIQAIDQRLKRVEATIDKLQEAIIQKVGEFGQSTNMIQKDLEALHNTTSKLMNPLIDNYRELEKINAKKRK